MGKLIDILQIYTIMYDHPRKNNTVSVTVVWRSDSKCWSPLSRYFIPKKLRIFILPFYYTRGLNSCTNFIGII